MSSFCRNAGDDRSLNLSFQITTNLSLSGYNHRSRPATATRISLSAPADSLLRARLMAATGSRKTAAASPVSLSSDGFGTGWVSDEYGRSEEPKSELQSLMHISYAVFCLKKKKYSYCIITL